jgi:glycosyltransferase involved in cell wall biosynthesis
MRVLHVIPALARRYGGPSTAVVSMCRATASRGVEAVIASTDADGRARLSVELEKPTDWDGVPALFFKRAFSESFKYSPRLARWLTARVGEFDIVHIHAVLSHAPLAGASAARKAGVPYIVRPLGTIASWSLGRKPFRKQLLLRLGAMRMLGDAAAIHYTSNEEQADAERTFGLSNGVVIPLGIDSSYFQASPSSDSERARDRYVLALSRLHPKKNLGVLIESFMDARERARDWRLVIAGAGDADYARSLERLVRDLGAGSTVTVTGWIDGNTKRDLISRASVFAMPSFHENFGVSLLEALAAGVPAVVSREVHLAATVEAAGAGWIAGTDRDSLGRALSAALGDAPGREARGRAAVGLAHRYGWPAIAEQLLDLYRTLTAAHVPRQSPASRSSRVEAEVARH